MKLSERPYRIISYLIALATKSRVAILLMIIILISLLIYFYYGGTAKVQAAIPRTPVLKPMLANYMNNIPRLNTLADVILSIKYAGMTLPAEHLCTNIENILSIQNITYNIMQHNLSYVPA